MCSVCYQIIIKITCLKHCVSHSTFILSFCLSVQISRTHLCSIFTQFEPHGSVQQKKKLPASLNIQYVRFGSLPAVNSETNRFLTVIKPRESSQGIKPRPPVSVPECNSHLPKQTTTKRKTMQILRITGKLCKFKNCKNCTEIVFPKCFINEFQGTAFITWSSARNYGLFDRGN